MPAARRHDRPPPLQFAPAPSPERLIARSLARRRVRAQRRSFAAASLAALIAIGLAAAIAGGDTAPTLPRGALRIVLGRPVSRPVAPGFLGLSVEYPSSIAYSGHDPARLNPTYLALVRTLNPGQAPVIRFGGDTTDWTWWPTPGVTRPPGIRYTLTKQWLAVTRATAQALGARLILGINFEADSRPVAASESRVLLSALGRRYVAGLELGNEPEVYGRLAWYTTPGGVKVHGRPRSYAFGQYLPDYHQILSALPAGVPLVGPATGAPAFWSQLGSFLAAETRVRTATVHRYPLNRCFTGPQSPLFATIANLLAPYASAGLANALAGQIATAHRAGAGYRVDELNSVACGGKYGVSDTFASALWMLDTLFGLARVGADGVNVHTFKDGRYSPFAFHFTGGRWHARVKPVYYGMLMFAEAAPPGARLLAAAGPGTAAVRTWATRARDGTVRVVLMNESPRRRATLAVRAPQGAASATVTRLTAPGLAARDGVRIAGLSYRRDTVTGMLAGQPRVTNLGAVQRAFVVRVPAGSAALLTIPR
jgi:hypothetical protein